MADTELARKIYKSLLKLRRDSVVRHPSGFLPIPEYHPVTVGTIEHLLDIDLSEDEIINRLNRAQRWSCGIFKANSAEAVVNLAIQSNTRTKQVNATNPDRTHDSKLPALIGSTAQILWAVEIRKKFALKFPESAELSIQKRASWWIENHR